MDKDRRADPILSNWLASDPSACKNWLQRQNPKRRSDALARLGETLIRYAKDPLATATDLWPDLVGNRKSSIAWSFVSSLSERDPNFAAEWLNRFADDPELDAARAKFAMDLTKFAPESAHVWATAIHDPVKRTDAEKSVFRSWNRLDPESAEAFFLSNGWDREQIDELRKN